MPDKSLSLAAYFSRHASGGRIVSIGDMPPRPSSGSVIWVRAQDASQLGALKDLESQLKADGDDIHLIITLQSATHDTFVTPMTRSQIRAFLEHWKPDLTLWLTPSLDANTLFELSQLDVPNILVGATIDTVRTTGKLRVPGTMRAMLRQFSVIMAVDAETKEALTKAGAYPDRIELLGKLESAPAALSHFEDERQDIAKELGARSIWFAADTDVSEIPYIAAAHHQASRRAHRLLLIVSLRDAAQGVEAADMLRVAGFSVALRSANEEADTATQVYVADIEGELGLWYRVAPITYLGKSLSGGPCRDPFEAAVLGSAVLHGPDVAPFQPHIERLSDADACVSLSSYDELGSTVEQLLSPDKTARIVHAAWDVTSRGADAINRLSEVILETLDGIGV
jgi:3-deoxy-D-manno-octulosonic-acid transferase